MATERQAPTSEATYPAFALAESRTDELQEMIASNKSPNAVIEWAKDIAGLLDNMCETWDKIRETQKELPDKLLQVETTDSIRRLIISLYMTATKAFSTERSPDYYWPVTWEDKEEDTQNVEGILGFWIENEEPVTATKAQNDLRQLLVVWYEAYCQHMAWKASRKFFKPNPPTPELLGAGIYRERFGPNWGKRARGRL